MNKLNIMLIIIQIFNIISSWFETGTQGSIDGYALSLMIGIILLIGIVITYLKINIIENKNNRIIHIILAIISLYLFYNQFPFIYNVTMNGYRINDVLTDLIVNGIAKESAGVFERILPVIMYIYIGTNIYVCLGRIRIKTRKNTKDKDKEIKKSNNRFNLSQRFVTHFAVASRVHEARQNTRQFRFPG